MSEIKEYFDEVLEELNSTDSRMDKLKLIVEYGKDLEEYPQEKVDEKHLVPGCVSNVYLHTYCENGLFHIYAKSDALVVGGYLAILLEGLNNKNYKDVLDNWNIVENFTKESGLKENLSPTRANAFGTILNLILTSLENYHHQGLFQQH